MMRGAWVVLRKEALDTVRDRRTLLFMILLPMGVGPLLGWGGVRLAERQARRQQERTVRIAASPVARDAYLALAHRVFLASPVAAGLQVAVAAQGGVLLEEAGVSVPDAPREVFVDPTAFASWARALASSAGRAASPDATGTAMDEVRGLPPAALRELERQAAAFHRTVVQGVGLVEFSAAASLPEPPADADLPPAGTLPDVPGARAAAWALRRQETDAWLEVREVPGDGGEVSREFLLVHDSTNPVSAEAFGRIESVVEEGRRILLRERLAARGLTEALLRPVSLSEEGDIATPSQRIVAGMAGMVPYLVLLFVFLGGMYPAIDMGAGEKERGTLETLLLSPCSRTELALGKFLLILSTSLIAAVLGVVSTAFTLRAALPAELLAQVNFRIEPWAVALVAGLAVPVAATVAGMLLAISIWARSFKEAQNYMTPGLFLLLVPAMLAVVPGVEIDARTAMIPVANVALLMKAFLQGQTPWGPFVLTWVSSLGAAAACLAFAVRQFGREEVLFR